MKEQAASPVYRRCICGQWTTDKGKPCEEPTGEFEEEPSYRLFCDACKPVTSKKRPKSSKP